MKSELKKMISGVVCLACVVTSATAPGAVRANAINLDNPVIVSATDSLENGLEYKIYEDHVEITGYNQSTSSEIIIPETIKELPVTSIKEHTFMYYGYSLTSITIPDSVTNIEGFAFMRCTSLESLIIPKNVESIGEWAFCGCDALVSIQVAPENQNYMDVDGILFSKDQKVLRAYPAAKTEQSYAIPEGVTSIAKSAFWDSSLTSVTIPDSVTSIGDGAFQSCRSLKSIIIPKSITNIERLAFNDCSSLESITILNPDCEIGDMADTINKTAVIYGYPGSTAQAYAEKYNREFVALDKNQDIPDTSGNPEVTWGDASGDGVVDISDVVLMNRVCVGVDQISDEAIKSADTDLDGKLTLADSMNVLRLLVHLLDESDFPIGS